ncbi:unnamed protein product [Heterobilharzia americana]|nr:unnamed protein product [Heterobilharzia americana]
MNTRRRSCFSPRPDVKSSDFEFDRGNTTESPISPFCSSYTCRSTKFDNDSVRKNSHDNMSSLTNSSVAEHTDNCRKSGQRTLRQRSASGTPSESSCAAEVKLSSVSIKPRGLMNRRLRRPSKVIPICGLCLGTSELNNKTKVPEEMIACWECGQSGG